MTTYAELRLRIDRGVADGSHRIVATGPAGEAIGQFTLPFSDLELENFILKVGTTRRARRRIESPEMQLAKDFGAKLFDALFEGDVGELYRSSFAETRSSGQGLRVSLSLTDAPELLQVPWEYLYDRPSFLSISTWTPIVRYLDLPKPRRPLEIELPLRILALVSAPADEELIDAQQERTKLEAALGPLIGMGAVEIDWLEEAGLLALQRQLRKADYHVFHYIGHGGYDQAADDGVLLFEDEHGRGRRVSGIELGTILADEVSLRLAVLNSCEGARSSLRDPFSGVATSLIEREIPAVIGMQFAITDRAAILFAGEFYAALADGLPVDSSVAEARKAIYADQNDVEWGTPVLFMRVGDGRLFDVKAHAPIRPPPSAPPAQSDDARATDEEAAVREEATLLAVPPAAASVSQQAAVAAAGAAPGPTTVPGRGPSDIQADLPRAAGRAALGGLITTAMGFATLILDGYWSGIGGAAGEFPGAAALMAIALVAAVTLAERLSPAVRVPGGSLYRPVGGNRWTAAAIQGAFAGATVGFVVAVSLLHQQVSINTAFELALFTAASFVIAEMVLNRLDRRRADDHSAADG